MAVRGATEAPSNHQKRRYKEKIQNEKHTKEGKNKQHKKQQKANTKNHQIKMLKNRGHGWLQCNNFLLLKWNESKRQLISYVGKLAHKERQKKHKVTNIQKKEKLIIDRPYIYRGSKQSPWRKIERKDATWKHKKKESKNKQHQKTLNILTQQITRSKVWKKYGLYIYIHIKNQLTDLIYIYTDAPSNHQKER